MNGYCVYSHNDWRNLYIHSLYFPTMCGNNGEKRTYMKNKFTQNNATRVLMVQSVKVFHRWTFHKRTYEWLNDWCAQCTITMRPYL